MSPRGFFMPESPNRKRQKKGMNRGKEKAVEVMGRGTIAPQEAKSPKTKEMAEMNSHGNPMVEDESFPFGGYWKGTVKELIHGDGVRLTPTVTDPAWFVEHIENREGGETVLLLTDRRVHVANVVVAAFNRPVEGMSDDPGLHALVVSSETECWVRI